MHLIGTDAQNTREISTGWIRFLVQCQKDFKLWIVLIAFMSSARLGILLFFRQHWATGTGLWDLIKALLQGSRYDMQIVTVFILLLMLCGLIISLRFCKASLDECPLLDHLRRIMAVFFICTTTLIFAIDIGFFKEYHSQFNHFIFGLVYDDRRAILSTIWKSYHPITTLMGSMLVAAFWCFIALRFSRRAPISGLRLADMPWSLPLKLSIGALLLMAVVTCARGRASSRPLQMGDAAVVADRCLNAWVPTPYHVLNRAINNWRSLRRSAGLSVFIPDGDLRAAVDSVFPVLAEKGRVEDCMERKAPGTAKPPRHVFLVVMESFDAWALMDRWRVLGITEQVAALGREGVMVTDFLPASTGTMTSLSSLLTGLPDVGVHTPIQANAQKPLPSSMAAIFKRLGYRSRFFYSGYLSWQNLGDFCKAQGFDEIYGGGHIGNPEGKDWGVDDEELFAFVLRQLKDDAPTFNVILTTSNHPPYQVDVDAKGFPMKEISTAMGLEPAGGMNRRLMGHLWYADRSVGQFVRSLEERLPRTLVALTGDHWSRHTPTANPSFYERSAVPFVLHGPEVLAGVRAPAGACGGHLDITPTLVDLCAPKGFSYASFGENLLQTRQHCGLGNWRAIGPGWILNLEEPILQWQPTTGKMPEALKDSAAVSQYHRTVCALAWWRLMCGEELPGGKIMPSVSLRTPPPE